MIGHVSPHRWADAVAGRVSAAERATMTAHAASCARCARARDRVTAATGAFAAIRAQPAPEVSWDHVRARVHWSVSSEKRASGRMARPPELQPRVRWRRAAPWLVAAAAASALVVASGPMQLPMGARPAPVSVAAIVPAVAAAPTRPPPTAPTALHGLVSRASGEIKIDGVRPDDLFERQLGAGTVIATGDGKLDVQFGDASAFALGPHSRLELRAFDAAAVELAVDGTVDVEVAPRAPGQRFVVLAGTRTVEVRGTQFRVTHDAAGIAVACRHGLVAVRDAGGEVDVGAAHRVALAPVARSLPAAVAMTADELAVLAQATPLSLPLWDSGLLRASAPLEIVTPGQRAVRVDGVELGDAPLRVRVIPGRHLVETADSAGRYRRAGWAEVAAPTATSHGARLEVPADTVPSAGAGERRRQLLAGIDHARIGRCTRSITKAGLSGTYVQIELAVDAAGAIGVLNVLDTDLPAQTAACVREVLADVHFGAGAAASWRQRIDL